MTIDQILENIYPLPELSREKIKKHTQEIHFPKNHILLRAEKIEQSIYFIKKGIVRAYTKTDSLDITFWFGKEGDTIISMSSYVLGQKGYEDIELLENCELFKLNSQELQNLYKQDIHIANWGRKFAEKELIQTEERFISRQFRTAKERYKELLNYHPELIQRVQLSYIASYLGITQVSLSRIRNDIR